MTPGFDSSCAFREKRKFDSFPIALYFREESLTPSPCVAGLTGKESCAFKRKEASFLLLVRKDLWEGYLPTISNRWGRIALHLGRDYPFEHTKN